MCFLQPEFFTPWHCVQISSTLVRMPIFAKNNNKHRNSIWYDFCEVRKLTRNFFLQWVIFVIYRWQSLSVIFEIVDSETKNRFILQRHNAFANERMTHCSCLVGFPTRCYFEKIRFYEIQSRQSSLEKIAFWALGKCDPLSWHSVNVFFQNCKKSCV